uniref:Uncharacterized protein n=1 Tax=viral metagenome TaxID=1070528 RepID=A0A6C0IPX1_9ZZZZ
MNGIYNTDSSFDFQGLHLAKPYQIPGGSFFIRISTDNNPLYIQPPKCTTKQGILKAGKKVYTDLVFTNEHSDFIEWMEKLEAHCQSMLYNNRNEWFEGEMEMHDIENYFTSPLKIYKSGKFYISRVNIATNLGRPTLKIYNEDEQLVNIDDVNEKMNIMSILEIRGIKCSATSFQIDIDVKQMMTLTPEKLFDKCLFTSAKSTPVSSIAPAISINPDQNAESSDIEDNAHQHDTTTSSSNDAEQIMSIDTTTSSSNDAESVSDNDAEEIIVNDTLPTSLEKDVDSHDDVVIEDGDQTLPADEEPIQEMILNEKHSDNVNTELIEKPLEEFGMQEVKLYLDEIPENNNFSIKNKNNVYYEMYKEAKRKAKVARDLALSSYLEAKRIKNVYMLDDASDSEDSDYDNLESNIE